MRAYAILLTLLGLIAAIPSDAAAQRRGFGDSDGSSDAASEPTGVRRALVIGISDYADDGIPDLSYADADALAFAEWLRTAPSALPLDTLVLLTNGQATRRSISRAIGRLRDHTTAGDELVLYFAGHGGVHVPGNGSGEKEGYLYAHDSEPDDFTGSMVSMEHLISLMNKVDPQSRILVVLDACRSGQAFRGDLLVKTLGRSPDNMYALLSSGPGQDSQEDAPGEGNLRWDGHGVFTYFLLHGLNGFADQPTQVLPPDGRVTLEEVYGWVTDFVSAETGQAQRPLIFNSAPLVLAQADPEYVAALTPAIEARVDALRSQLGVPTQVASRGAPPPAPARAGGDDAPPPPPAPPGPRAAAPPSAGSGSPAAARGITGSIRLGETVRGTLTDTDSVMNDKTRVDVWRYRGRAGQRLSITMRSEQFDSFLLIRQAGAESGRFLRQNDDGAGDLNARVILELPADGEYLILANGVSPTDLGDYELSVEESTGAVPMDAAQVLASADGLPALETGGFVTGRLSESGPLLHDGTRFESWVLRGEPGEQVEIEMTTEAFGPFLAIGAVGGDEYLAGDGEGPTARKSLVAAGIPENGVLIIVANAFDSDASGEFTLRVKRARPTVSLEQVISSPGDAAGALRMSRTVRGELTTDAPLLADLTPHQVWTYDGRAGDRVTFIMRSEDVDAFLGIGRMLDGGESYWITDDDSEGGTDARLTVELPEDGRYVVIANTYRHGAHGSYSLSVEEGTGPAAMDVPALLRAGLLPGTPVIEPGRPQAGLLEEDDIVLARDRSRVDVWRFSGRQGQRVTITMQSSDFDTFLAVGAPDGELLGHNDDADDGGTDSRVTLTLPQDGDYAILANAYDASARGAYILRLESADERD